MRRPPISFLRPSAIELWYVAFATCVIVLVGNGKLVLERAGLISSADLIGQQVSNKVLLGTNSLDRFRFTASAIDLIIWGATGMLIYSILQSIIRVLRTIEYERDFDSGQYVHPQWYNHEAYWRQIISDTILGFGLLVLLAFGALALLAVAIPNSFVYVQRFILTPTIRTFFDLFLGFDIAFVGTLILYLFLKLVIRHHRLTSTIETGQQ